MRRSDFIPEGDPAALRLENELLLHEVAYLRANVAELQKSAGASAARALIRDTSAEKELAEAKKDLRWILRRLRSSPIGWVLRRRGGFAKLWERWVEDEAGS